MKRVTVVLMFLLMAGAVTAAQRNAPMDNMNGFDNKIKELDQRLASLEAKVVVTPEAQKEQGFRFGKVEERIMRLEERINKLEARLNKLADSVIAVEDKVDARKGKRPPTETPTFTPVPTNTPAASKTTIKKVRITVKDTTTKRLGKAGEKGRVAFAYKVNVENDEAREAKSFKVKIMLKDSDGFTLDTYIAGPFTLTRWEEKTLEGEGTIRADRADKVSSSESEIIWE
ncbi:MAG: hypothetical protein LLG37_06765 [Spirochaetia bacterium]|nr:hypothetical protein [Spirochaetia bacterium]